MKNRLNKIAVLMRIGIQLFRLYLFTFHMRFSYSDCQEILLNLTKADIPGIAKRTRVLFAAGLSLLG